LESADEQRASGVHGDTFALHLEVEIDHGGVDVLMT
jgi:hypothetical protein